MRYPATTIRLTSNKNFVVMCGTLLALHEPEDV